VTHLGERSHGPYVDKVDEATCSQFQYKPRTGKDAAPLVQGETLEVILQKLGVTIKERDEVRMQLDSLQRTLGLEQYKPCSDETLSCLGWVHRLNDKEDMVYATS
jgi:hypothetical protein